MEEEIWKPVPGYGNRISASNLGRVRRNSHDIFKNDGWTRLPEKIYGAKPGVRGYPVINLRRDGETRSSPRPVHHLVLSAFVGPRPTGTEGAHGDGNPLNARLDNLRWATPVENNADKLAHGTMSRGADRPGAKLTDRIVANILRDPRPHTRIAEELGVTQPIISRIKARKLWRHVAV